MTQEALFPEVVEKEEEMRQMAGEDFKAAALAYLALLLGVAEVNRSLFRLDFERICDMAFAEAGYDPRRAWDIAVSRGFVLSGTWEALDLPDVLEQVRECPVLSGMAALVRARMFHK